MTAPSTQPRIHAAPPQFPAVARRIARLAGALAVGAGTVALAGWTFDVELLKGFGHRITMKPNAAFALIACGVALWTAHRRDGARAVAGLAAAIVASTLGGLTFAEHAFDWNAGIDQVMFPEMAGAAGTASPGRMGPNASISFTLGGLALVALRRGSRRAVILAQSLALVIATLATSAIVGYVYGAQELYSAARYTGIAWPTTVTLLAVALGILAVRPDAGPVSAIVSDGPGGILARRMLLPVVLVPLILGYLHLAAEERGLVDRGLGSAVFAVALVLVFAATVWRTSVRLDAANRARAAVQDERDDLLVRERAARAEAERASRLKDEFLATLSHELRTPLNVILGWAHMVRVSGGRSDEALHAAAIVARNGQMLARLVDDLLDVSRIATGRLHLELKPVDLVRLVAAAVDGIRAEAEARGIRLVQRLEGPPAVVLGDAGRLHQVATNLLSNALKFTPPSGTVEVTVHRREGAVELTVHDSGAGIDPLFLPHVFDRFRQQDATSTREHGGLGLGLSIVREFTELHGGSVMAHSEGLGAGSRFTVTLPVVSPASPAEGEGRARPV